MQIVLLLMFGPTAISLASPFSQGRGVAADCLSGATIALAGAVLLCPPALVLAPGALDVSIAALAAALLAGCAAWLRERDVSPAIPASAAILLSLVAIYHRVEGPYLWILGLSSALLLAEEGRRVGEPEAPKALTVWSHAWWGMLGGILLAPAVLERPLSASALPVAAGGLLLTAVTLGLLHDAPADPRRRLYSTTSCLLTTLLASGLGLASRAFDPGAHSFPIALVTGGVLLAVGEAARPGLRGLLSASPDRGPAGNLACRWPLFALAFRTAREPAVGSPWRGSLLPRLRDFGSRPAVRMAFSTFGGRSAVGLAGLAAFLAVEVRMWNLALDWLRRISRPGPLSEAQCNALARALSSIEDTSYFVALVAALTYRNPPLARTMRATFWSAKNAGFATRVLDSSTDPGSVLRPLWPPSDVGAGRRVFDRARPETLARLVVSSNGSRADGSAANGFLDLVASSSPDTVAGTLCSVPSGDGARLFLRPRMSPGRREVFARLVARAPATAAELLTAVYRSAGPERFQRAVLGLMVPAAREDFWRRLCEEAVLALLAAAGSATRATVLELLPLDQATKIFRSLHAPEARMAALSAMGSERAAGILLSLPIPERVEILARLPESADGLSLSSVAARIPVETLAQLVAADRDGEIPWGTILELLSWPPRAIERVARSLDPERALRLLARCPSSGVLERALCAVEGPTARNELDRLPELAVGILRRLSPEARLAALDRWRPGDPVVTALPSGDLAAALGAIQEKAGKNWSPWIEGLGPEARARVLLALPTCLEPQGRLARLRIRWRETELPACPDRVFADAGTPHALALLLYQGKTSSLRERLEEVVLRFPPVEVDAGEGEMTIEEARGAVALRFERVDLPPAPSLADLFAADRFDRTYAEALRAVDGPLYEAVERWLAEDRTLEPRLPFLLGAGRRAFHAPGGRDPAGVIEWLATLRDVQRQDPWLAALLCDDLVPRLGGIASWPELAGASLALAELARRAADLMGREAAVEAIGGLLPILLDTARTASDVEQICERAGRLLVGGDGSAAAQLLLEGHEPWALAASLDHVRGGSRAVRVALAAYLVLEREDPLVARRVRASEENIHPDPYARIEPPPWGRRIIVSASGDEIGNLHHVCRELLEACPEMTYRLCLETLLAGETLLLIGPPSSGKTTRASLAVQGLLLLDDAEMTRALLHCHNELSRSDVAVLFDLAALVGGREVVRARPLPRAPAAIVDDLHRASADAITVFASFLERRVFQLAGRQVRARTDGVVITMNLHHGMSFDLPPDVLARIDLAQIHVPESLAGFDPSTAGPFREMVEDCKIEEDVDRPLRPEVAARLQAIARLRRQLEGLPISSEAFRGVSIFVAMLGTCLHAGAENSDRNKAHAYAEPRLEQLCQSCPLVMPARPGAAADHGQVCSAITTSPGFRGVHALFRSARIRAFTESPDGHPSEVTLEHVEPLVPHVYLHRLQPTRYLAQPGTDSVNLDRLGFVRRLWQRAQAHYHAYAEVFDRYFDLVAEARQSSGPGKRPSLAREAREIGEKLSGLESVLKFPMLHELRRIEREAP
ncbi:MAG: hypothetical protein HY720_31060 [Planctomycetes bacterium]|nr:hypothetical protein [Planctomycetota bacterium]